MTDEEMVEAVGEDVAKRLPMYNSDCNAADDFEYFGETSFGTPVWINKLICDVDLVIMTGTIVHHFFAGLAVVVKQFCLAYLQWKPFVEIIA